MEELIKTDKLIIYQILTRLFGNRNLNNKFNGNLEENGSGKFNDINDNALESIKNLGISHVWFTGILEHATKTDYCQNGILKDSPDIVKGNAGSPYAIKDYFDVDPDLAVDPLNRMNEFELLIKRSHNNHLKVIIDFIPNHVARQYHSDNKPDHVEDLGASDDHSIAFSNHNNFYYLPGESFNIPNEIDILNDGDYKEYPAKATGNDVFSAKPNINDWYETIKLNYGIDYQHGFSNHFSPIPNTWIKMKEILLFWAAKGVDGFRCDMVEMVPVAFWEWITQEIKKAYPNTIFIGEAYNPQVYHDYIFMGGFDYLYDKVGLYDALRRLIEGNGNANDISKVWQNESGAFSNRMLRFLENHDEQRIVSKQFTDNPFNALTGMALSAFLHTGPLMIYFGQELGLAAFDSAGFQKEDGRTTIFDYWGLKEMAQWNNQGNWNFEELSLQQQKLRKAYKAIINMSTKNEAISAGEFFDLQYFNMEDIAYKDNKVYSFLRYTPNQKLLLIFNFDLENAQNVELKIPSLAWEMMGVKTQSVKLINLKAKKGIKNSLILTTNHFVPLQLSQNSWEVFEILTSN